jgi:uncharacterized protein YuzE
MKIEYDREADALHILLRDAEVDDNLDITDGVTIDLDANRQVIGLEILDVSKKLSLSDIVNNSIENLPLERIERAAVV